VGILGDQGVELFGRSEACVSHVSITLCLFLIICMSSTPANVHCAASKDLNPSMGTGKTFHCAIVLCYDIVTVFDLADGDGRAVLLVVALDGGFIGLAAIDGKALIMASATAATHVPGGST
jgi:hypothetical protein